jgi:hypothetical protein
VDDLVQFLRDRLDEDEAVAAAASPGPWRPSEEADEVLAVDGITVADGFALSGRQLRATTEHIARHDPARVLSEIEAKRALIDACDRADTLAAYPDFEGGVYSGLHDALEYLALPYADHPQFKPEWRP